MKIVTRWASLGLLMLFALVPAARAQVMQQVPAEAIVVIRIANLEKTSAKFAAFANELGLAQLQPELADPLASFQKQANIEQGLNRTGDMAFVFIDPQVVPAEDDQNMLVLLPVTDYKQFLANFPEADANQQISEVVFPDTEEPAFLTNWGNYAVISRSREAAALKPAGIKPQGAVAKELETKDAVAFLNMPRLRQIAIPALHENREQIIQQLQEGFGQARPDMANMEQVVRSIAEHAINVAEVFLNEATGASMGLNLAEGGISTTFLVDFQEGGQFASAIKGFKNTEESMLRGLPEGKYLFYGGMVNDPQASQQVIAQLVDPIINDLRQAAGDQKAAVDQYYDALKRYLAGYQSTSFGMVAPAGELGMSPLIQFLSVVRGDAQQIQSSYADMIKAQEELTNAFGEAGAQTQTEITPKAKTVDGVAFDLYQTEITMDPQTPEAAQAQQAMMFMYGPDGVNVLSGVVDNKTVLVVSGVEDEVISSAIASAKANQDPLAKLAQVQAVSQQLPKSRVAAFYVPVDEIVSTTLGYANRMGFAIPLELPPDLPPIGATVATEGGTIRIDSYTPMELVRSLVAASMQLQMQMQGGGRPGGAL